MRWNDRTVTLRVRQTAWLLLLSLLVMSCSEDKPITVDRVSMVVFGQAKIGPVLTRGLHGWSGTEVSVQVTALAPCRFRLASADRAEEVDFGLVHDIRVSLISDPASGLTAVLAGRQGMKRDIEKVILVQLIGAEGAVCSDQGCRDRQSFAIRHPDQIEAIRAAAAALQDNRCHGSSHDPSG